MSYFVGFGLDATFYGQGHWLNFYPSSPSSGYAPSPGLKKKAPRFILIGDKLPGPNLTAIIVALVVASDDFE